MSKTLTQLVAEVGNRQGEFALSTPTALGTTTTLIDTGLDQVMPVSLAANHFNAWFYGRTGVVGANVGVERRANQWTQTSHTVTFKTAWPTAVTAAGTYEIHRVYPRARIVEALNDAIGCLGLYWVRQFVDESITTAVNTWRYTLPSAQNWAIVDDVQIQVVTDTALPTYPYAKLDESNFSIYKDLSTAGVETWYIQFSSQPPSGRKLRILGRAYYSDLALDADVLGLGGKWERPALKFIYGYAGYLLNDWQANKMSSDTAKYRQKSLDYWQRQKEEVLEMRERPSRVRLILPGMGDGTFNAAQDDPNYLAAFSAH